MSHQKAVMSKNNNKTNKTCPQNVATDDNTATTTVNKVEQQNAPIIIKKKKVLAKVHSGNVDVLANVHSGNVDVVNGTPTKNDQIRQPSQYISANSIPNISRRQAGSNWNTHFNGTEIQSSKVDESKTSNEENNAPTISKAARLRKKRKEAKRDKYVAMDCEMVGIGSKGENDMLARVSIVNKVGDVLLDKFVKPQEEVTDYRTEISGIRAHNILDGEDFSVVQDQVINILQGKILIGHAIRNDLAVLRIKHPYVNVRDTSRYKPLCKLVANGHTPSLKRLSKAILGIDIQTGEHNSIEDARATMCIYNRLSNDWEKYILDHQQHKHRK